MMNKSQKKQYIENMTSQFEKTEAVIVTHYQGLTVSQLDDLILIGVVLNYELQSLDISLLTPLL